VLFDTANGHSFEVDVWSVGVILYTLLIGKPPFQTKDVKTIYRRIRENQYEFPPDKEISTSAQELIMSILNSDPRLRPTLQEILQHPWFQEGIFPSQIPSSAMDTPPVFRNYSAKENQRNYDMVKLAAQEMPATVMSPPPTVKTGIGKSIAAQERDFNNAVQPDSPISALLSSARQPLVQAPPTIKEGSLMRKLTAAGAQSTLSPVRRGILRNPPAPSASRAPAIDEVAEEEEDEDEETPEVVHGRYRELAQQKARIVSQMAGLKISDKDKDRDSDKDKERMVNQMAGLEISDKGKDAQSVRPSGPSSSSSRAPLREASRVPQTNAPAALSRKPNLYDRIENNLANGLDGNGAGLPAVEAKPPKVFVVSWLDYCAKYGMGFTMTDGTVSVFFNDFKSLVLAPGQEHFDYVGLEEGGRVRNYPIDKYPSELKSKVFLLGKFQGYMLDRLVGNHQYTYVDKAKTTGMVYIEKYLRMRHIIIFRLSNGVLQVSQVE
jgi:polo-like kinase 1